MITVLCGRGSAKNAFARYHPCREFEVITGFKVDMPV